MSLDEELAQKLHEEEQARFNAEQEAKLNAEQEELLASYLICAYGLCYGKERTKRAGLNLQEESSKKQKTGEGSEPTKELKADEISQEDLQQMIMVVPVEEVYVEALQVKYPIIDWEKFNRDDLDKLWSLVKERFNSTDPTNDKERTLWVELKRGHDIFMLVEKDYPLTRGLLTLMLCNKLEVDQYSEMADELLMKIVNHKFRRGLLGIKGFYKFLVLVQLSTAKRRLSTAKLS
ncbi:hypothetical protein Tco_1449244 [Tanacetum coccineum]